MSSIVHCGDLFPTENRREVFYVVSLSLSMHVKMTVEAYQIIDDADSRDAPNTDPVPDTALLPSSLTCRTNDFHCLDSNDELLNAIRI